MFRSLGSLRVLSFVLIAVGLIVAAEMSQAVAEGFLLEEENQMTALVNEHRASIGRGKLDQNDALRTVARRQAQRMVMAGYIYHNPDLAKEASDAVPGWLLVGENVGVGPSVTAVEQAFLDSPKHRENIEEPGFNIVGLGAMPSSDGGSLYFTQNFAKTGRPKAAPAAVARTEPPAPVVVARTPRPARAAATPAPTAAVTPSPVPATPSPGVLAAQTKPGGSSFGLFDGLLAMFGRALAKLAFWR